MTNEISNIPSKGNKKRVIIVGGGFAGLKVAHELDTNHFQILLIDRSNHHIFQPLLYQVTTAGVEPTSISFPFRKIFRKKKDFHIRICEAKQIIPEEKILQTSIGDISYDYLIVATGTETNYFGNDKLADETMTLKNIADALYNRNKVLESLEKAQNTQNPSLRNQLMTFIIVGGGPTGIELAGALAEMRNTLLSKEYPDLEIENMKIILMDANERILATFSEKSSKSAQKALENRGVEIHLNTRVKDYKNNTLIFNESSALYSQNVFWVAGVKATTIPGLPQESYGHGNRLNVNSYNQVNGYDHIFAIGDTALMITKDYPKGHPQVAQPAIQQGKRLGENLNRLMKNKEMKEFDYFNLGTMATIGRNDAIVEIKNLHFDGFIGWISWLFIHLMNIIGVKNRLFIMMDWMWSYFRYDPSLRLIIQSATKKEQKEEDLKHPIDSTIQK